MEVRCNDPAAHGTLILSDSISNLQQPYKLNVGAGNLTIPGWINFDIHAVQLNAEIAGTGRPDNYQHDFRNGLPFPNDTVSAILVSHVFYAYSVQTAKYLAAESYRCLSPRGVLRVTENNNKSFYFPSVSYWDDDRFLELLLSVGFAARVVGEDETLFWDTSILLNAHGGRPKACFVEGIKPAKV